MEESIFTKIIKGDIPCHKIYEDDKTIAFLDIHPLVAGHMLVVPKVQVDDFERLTAEDYQAVFATVHLLAKRLKAVTGARKSIIMVLGFDVPHAHVHILPGNSAHEFYEALENRDKTEEPDLIALAEMAKKLKV